MNQLLRPSDLLAPQQTFAFPSRRDPQPRGSRGITVNVTDIHKSFGDQPVLKGIDLVVPAGQFIAIVGRSGCGKSTLLRLIAGLERAETGSIDLDGNRRGDRSHGVRFMFQEPRLLPWARVRDNVKVGLGRGVDPGEASSRAAGALQEVGLTDKAGQWPSVLSGGQRQRVALARALVSQPDLLLFDEPLGALDALTRITMQELLARVWTEQGFTAVLVTHDVQEAVALADRILVIEDGQIAQDVTIDLPRPRRRGDAEFAALEGDILARLMTGIA